MFLLLVANANAAPAAPAAAPEMTAPATQWKGEVPAAKGRLKFKTAGPVCICGEGLSERDIERAMARSRLDRAAVPDSDASLGQTSGQEKPVNVNVGVTK